MTNNKQIVNVAFLESKLCKGYSPWCQHEVDWNSQGTNIHRLSESVFSFEEYNYLPSCEQDILDGHFTFFVNKDTFEYLVYKSSDYGSFTYVLPVKFDGFHTDETLPAPSKAKVESIIAHKLLTSYFHDSNHVNHRGKSLVEDAHTAEDYHELYSKRSLICDNRGYIWSDIKPETYSDIELLALNKLCGFVQPDIKDFDADFVKSFTKGFKVLKTGEGTQFATKGETKYINKYNELEINGKHFIVVYRNTHGNYKDYSLLKGTIDNIEGVVCSDSDTLPVSRFVKIIPTVLRNMAL